MTATEIGSAELALTRATAEEGRVTSIDFRTADVHALLSADDE